MKEIPDEFIEYVFRERRRLVEKVLCGEREMQKSFLGFTRHTPAIISNGPAGMNGSIKGIGFVHKEAHLHETINELKRFSGKDWKGALRMLLKRVYVEEKIDFSKLSTLEMTRKHSWQNFLRNPEASILFYTPPKTSYEVRAKVEIHEEGPYWEYVKLVHDVFYAAGREEKRDWKETPAYVFLIRQIYDNSPTKRGIRIF